MSRLCKWSLFHEERKEYNAVVERTRRTDDEEFYIPKTPLVKDRENFLYRAMQWTYYFNMHRVHW
jgi:hypothetical protein